ncbi:MULTISPECIES: DUF6173 family protein [Burkholderia cepacia complex]|uniref:DUF6173 family protein n=1 Tax=Burkholderia cepacia complex TaxID=87882 RepID=UPI0015947106|nr:MULTISPECIES: DUF6173 family protein [Burkholderia cepacia complex]
MPELPVIKTASEYAFDTLVEEIKAFEASLAGGEAVGAMLASFGKEVTIQITQIASAGQFICFDGVTADGSHARLVQHFTQASLLLVKLAKPVAPANPIGFVHSN